MNDVQMTFAEKILEIKGMRLPQFASRYGFSLATLKAYNKKPEHKSHRNPGPENLKKLSHVLKLSMKVIKGLILRDQ